MRMAVVNAGVVENIIEASDGFAIAGRQIVPATGATSIGDTYAAGTFTAPLPPTPTKRDVFDAAIAIGFAVLPEGFTLSLAPDAVANWTSFKGQLRDGLDLGAFVASDICPIPLTDAAGVNHTLTVQRIREILFAGGNYYAGLVAAMHS